MLISDGQGILPIRRIQFVLYSLTVLSPALCCDGIVTLGSEDVISGIDKAQKDRQQKLTGYSTKEHYTVRNSHFTQAAELTASVIYQESLGKTYTVLSRSGPRVLQEYVINRLGSCTNCWTI